MRDRRAEENQQDENEDAAVGVVRHDAGVMTAPDENAPMVALAKAIHQRMREWEAVNAADFKIDNAISRILENDPTYVPYRPRTVEKSRGPAVEPSVFTIKKIAERLDTTVSDLLGETTLDISVSDRRRIRDWMEFLRQRLPLDSLDDEVPRALEDRFPIRHERFIEREYDLPAGTARLDCSRRSRGGRKVRNRVRSAAPDDRGAATARCG